MSPRSLFIIILRVLGILMLQQVFTQLTDVIYYVVNFIFVYRMSDGLLLIFISLIGLLISLWVAYWLIFKPDVLVTRLALDKNFSESGFQLNISVDSIVHIALIVVAGMILITEIPHVIQLVYTTLRQEEAYGTVSPDWAPVIFSVIRIVIALLLIGERKRILSFLMQLPPATAVVSNPEVKENEPG